ncbi:MAG: Gfo/Idh/MocA family oxidoreductase [Planctomycetes bacterium]|nr:Gfo/Idh/MocA family oxidoreductase [Planctomycetota bacterium]
MSRKVRLGLVGCRGWSRSITQPAIRQCKDVELVAVANRPENQQPARDVAEAFGATFFPSIEELVRCDEVEAVVMITPNEVHREQTELCLAAGKHVFIEKPIANTVEDGMAMARAAEASGLVMQVGHNTRQRRAAKHALRLMKEGAIGQVIGAEFQYCHNGAARLAPDAWRQDPAKAPGLPLVQLGIHGIDVMNMFFGRPRTVASFHRKAVLPRNLDCTASIVAYDDPITVTLSSNYVVPLTIWFRCLGTEGTIEAQDFYRKMVIKRMGRDTEEVDYPEDLSTVTEMTAFAKAVRGEIPVETDGRAGVYALAVVEASIKSAQENRFIEIDEIIGDF